MAETVKINKAQLKRIRNEQGLSIQSVINRAVSQNIQISKSTLERMEGETYEQEIKLTTVKLVAEVLGVPMHKIIEVTPGFIDVVKLAPLTEGRTLRDLIYHKSAKLIVEVYDEPSDVELQNKILNCVKTWEFGANKGLNQQSQSENIQQIFEFKNQLTEFKSLGMNLFYGKSYEIAFFDILGGWEPSEEGVFYSEETVNFLPLQPKLLGEAQSYSDDYVPDPDGIGAQQVNILVFSQSGESPTYEHDTNPYNFTADAVKNYTPKKTKK